MAVFSITSGDFQGYIGNENELIHYPSGIFVREDDIFVSYSHSGRFHVTRFARSGTFEASYVCNKMQVEFFRFLIVLLRVNNLKSPIFLVGI